MTHELLPPGGTPHPPLTPPGPAGPDASGATRALPQADAPGGSQASYVLPQPPGSPVEPSPRTPVAGTNGLAIAALCCGLAGFVPPAAVVAIVLGVVALNQLGERIQKGRGMAIAGVVLGGLWVVFWLGIVVVAITDTPERGASGVVTESTDAWVEDLRSGDCFTADSGTEVEEVDAVTIVPCSSPHESQVVTTFTLPAGRWPGEDKVVSEAEAGCSRKADPLVTDRAVDELEPSFIYPTDAFSWSDSREILCTVDAPEGTTTGSALK